MAAGAEVLIAEIGTLAEEDFDFRAADAEVNDGVAEVEEDGVNHAETFPGDGTMDKGNQWGGLLASVIKTQ